MLLEPLTPTPEQRGWRVAAAVAAAALVPRAVFLWQLRASSPTFEAPEGGDSAFYDQVAQHGRVAGRAFFHSPLYQGWLTLLYRVFGRDLLAVRLVQLGLGALSAGLVAALAWRLSGRRGVALLAGLAQASFGPGILYEGQLLVDALLPLALVVAAHAVVSLARAPRPVTAAAAGAAIGVAAVGRGTALLWLVPLVVWLAHRPPGARRGTLVAALLVGAFTPILPVTALNLRAEADPVLLTANGGLNLYIGNGPDATGAYVPPRELEFTPGDPAGDFAGRRAAELARLFHRVAGESVERPANSGSSDDWRPNACPRHVEDGSRSRGPKALADPRSQPRAGEICGLAGASPLVQSTPSADGTSSPAGPGAAATGDSVAAAAHPDTVSPQSRGPESVSGEPGRRASLSSAALSRWWGQRALDAIAADPGRALGLVAAKARLLVSSYEQPQLYNLEGYERVAPVLGLLPGAGLVLTAGLLGLALLCVRPPTEAVRLITWCVVATAVAFLPFFVVGRFRAPWVTLLAVPAAWALVSLGRGLAARRWRQVTPLAAGFVAAGVLVWSPVPRIPAAPQYAAFAEAELARGRPAAALRWSTLATEDVPPYPRGWRATERALRALGRPADARFALRRATTLCPESGPLHRALGIIDLSLGHPARALVALERAVELDPGAPATWDALATALAATGRQDEAESAAESAALLR